MVGSFLNHSMFASISVGVVDGRAGSHCVQDQDNEDVSVAEVRIVVVEAVRFLV